MPVVRVGSTTGAKYGEWFPGSESSHPSAIAVSTVWVCRPPQNQKTVAERPQRAGDQPGAAMLLKRQLGMPVQVR
jgi:hypothetical protein